MRDMKPYYLSRFFILLCSLALLGMSFSCAGLLPKTPTTSPEKEYDIKQEDFDRRETPEEESDLMVDPYTDFTLASLYMKKDLYEEARPYLERAITNDKDSIYLKKKMAVLLQRLKDYQGAIEHARECVEIDPEDVGARLLLAEILAISGDEKGALQEYTKVLELQPEHQRVRLILVSNFIRSREYIKALEHLDILIRQNPNLDIAYYYRGRINLEMKRFEEAEKGYLKALDLNNSMEEHALFDLAGLYIMQKRYKEAAEVYERLISGYPANMVARERLINIYYKLGDKEKGDALIDDYKDLSKPGDPKRQALGLIYLQHGKLDESIMELDLIVTAWPDDQKSRYYLAFAYEEKGEFDKALSHFMLIKEDSEYYVNSLMQIAYILDKQERHDEAIDILNRALENEKSEAELYMVLASIYEKKEEYSRAIEILQEGKIADEKNIDILYQLGVVFDKSGDKDQSIKHMRELLKIEPNHADSLNYIGYTYAEQGIRLDEAQEMIERAIELKPDSGYIIDSLGWVFYQKGLYDKALVSLNKAFSLIPTDPTIAEHLGDTYFKIEEYDKSLEMYNKAIQLKHPKGEAILKKIEEVKKFLE
jgi:tetratricopeptide (TPR) repeat protein